MYQIWKLADGAAPAIFATCMTQMELLDIWSQKCSPVRAQLDFSTLNVTGKDTALQTRRVGFKWNDFIGYNAPVFVTEKVLKPYQVRDEFGRSVDIREWASVIRAWPSDSQKDYTYAAGLYSCRADGRKVNYRKTHEPAMYKDNLRGWERPNDEMEMELPFGHRNRNRNLRLMKQGRTPCKSWKRQSKSRKQWGRHMSVSACDYRSRIPEETATPAMLGAEVYQDSENPDWWMEIYEGDEDA